MNFMAMNTEAVMYMRQEEFKALEDIGVKTELKREIRKMFEKSLSTVSEEQIKNQLNQVINYSYNYLCGGREGLEVFRSNFFMILSEYTDDVEFLNSMKRSVDYMSSEEIIESLSSLKKGDKNSFIIVQLRGKGHVFAGIIYKRIDDKYDFVVINKGYVPRRGCRKYKTYEMYTMSEDNIKYIMRGIGGVRDCSLNIEVDRVYDILEDKGEYNSDESINSKIPDIRYSSFNSREQKTGNCFYKNDEAAILLAWHIAFNKDTKDFTPRGPISKKDLHTKFAKNIQKAKINREKRDLLQYVDKQIDIYRKNKDFRKYCENNKDVSVEEKRKACIEIFIGEEEKDSTNEKDLMDKVDLVLKKVDNQTLYENREVFEISSNVGLVKLLTAINEEIKNFPSSEEFIKMKDRLLKEEDELYKNIPVATWQIKERIALYLEEYQEVEVSSQSEGLNKVIANLNPKHVIKYLETEDFSEYSKQKEDKLREVCAIMPNDVYVRIHYVSMLMKGGKLKEALCECNDILEQRPSETRCIVTMMEILERMREQGTLDEAFDMYNKFIESDEKKTVAYYGLGIAHWYNNDKNKAEDFFKKAADLDFEYGVSYVKFLSGEEEYKEVLRVSNEVLKRKPNCLEIKKLRSDALMRGCADDGNNRVYVQNLKKLCTDVINSGCNSGSDYFRRGICNEELKLFKQAKDDYIKTIILEEDNEKLVCGAIGGLYRIGCEKNAIDRCAWYLIKYPDSPQIINLENNIFDDLDKQLKEKEKTKDEVEYILEWVIDGYNIGYFYNVCNEGAKKEESLSREILQKLVKKYISRQGKTFIRYQVKGLSTSLRNTWNKVIGVK